MKYRREIDGLRAVAVLPVILFHAGVDLFSGGYVGVDVFFVISGYLITTILITEQEAAKFSILRFYERRARRILPALFVVMASSIPFAWIWMSPVLFRDFCQSIIATIFFASNILFWRESGYFDESAEFKPLLHTWSLAVEEQYYVFFPLLLMLFPRLGRQYLFWIVIGLALASLSLSEWSTRYAPTANFYLIPTRAWELLTGSICAFVMTNRHVRASNLLGGAGLLMILVPIFTYTHSTPFPGLYALLPVAGTALIILFAQGETRVARILSIPPLVGIGLISYSAYLWHQPLFAFARLQGTLEADRLPMMFLAVCSIGLAYLTWRYVEQPFRRRPVPVLATRKSLFTVCGIASICFLGTAMILHMTPARLELIYPRYFEPIAIAKPPRGECPNFEFAAGRWVHCDVIGTGEKLAVIWGDSHAGAMLRVIEPRDGYSIMVLAHPVCPPGADLRRVETDETARGCRTPDILNSYLDYVTALEPDVVFMVARWTLYMRGWQRHGAQSSTRYVTDQDGDASDAAGSTQALTRGVKKAVERMAGQFPVYIVSQPVDLNFMSFHQLLLNPVVDRQHIDQWHAPEYAFLHTIRNTTAAQVLDTKSLFCSPDDCAIQQDGRPLYKDDNHLNALGGQKQWQMMTRQLGQ